MAKKKVYRRRTASVGIGTAIGATVTAASPFVGQFNLVDEAIAKNGIPENLLGKMVENCKQNFPQMIAGIAIPAVARAFLPNPTVYRGKRMTVKAM